MIAELISMLERLEWTSVDEEDANYCTICDRNQPDGHTEDCDVGKLMKKNRAYNLHEAKGCGNSKCHVVIYHHN